jgi:hypothetical protein
MQNWRGLNWQLQEKACRHTKETSKGVSAFYPRCGKGVLGQMY